MEVFLIIFAILAAVLYFYVQSPTYKGAAGERRVNSSLRSQLNEREYRVLDDLTLPTARGTTQIDHIVLSRYGIFVIETKNMAGWIFGSADQARWTVVLHRHKSQFQNPLRQNYHHVKVVQELLGVELRQIQSVVAFVGSAEPKTEMPRNVVWSTRSLSNYIRNQRDERFNDREL